MQYLKGFPSVNHISGLILNASASRYHDNGHLMPSYSMARPIEGIKEGPKENSNISQLLLDPQDDPKTNPNYTFENKECCYRGNLL